MTNKSKTSPAVSPLPKPRQRRTTKETANLKVKALKMADEGATPTEIGRALNLHRSVVGKWRTAAGHAQLKENLTEADKAKIGEMWDAGKNDRQIASELGLSQDTINRLYRRLRTKRRRNTQPNHPEEIKKKALDLLSTGRSIAAVAVELGVGHGAVERWYAKAIAEGTAKLVERSNRSEDVKLRWVTMEYPHLESWRSLAAEWVSEQKNVALALRSLTAFFDRYMVGHELPSEPLNLLRKNSTAQRPYLKANLECFRTAINCSTPQQAPSGLLS